MSKLSQSMRLDRYLATVTDYSRSEAKRLIKAGEVAVNGAVVADVGHAIWGDSKVCLRGQALRRAGPRYFMLNKPQGYICAAKDRRHLTVLDLLDEDNPERLHAAGRLDVDTTGLVLLTDDGQWSHTITSPQRHCWKRYYVEVAEVISEKCIAHFARGVFLKDDKARTLPAELEILAPQRALLRIQEGRYHQVKRMFAAEGNAVTLLHREAIGDIELDQSLAEGQYRPLSETEIKGVSHA